MVTMDLYFRYPASEYDKGRGSENISFWINEITRIAGLEENSTVLDLGCGTGSYAIKLRRKTSAKVHGIDPSAEMIEVARGKDLSDEIMWHVGVAESLPFAPKTFDCVFASQVWHHIGNKQKAASECYRVLKRGAPSIIRTFSHEQLKRIETFRFFPEILPSQLEAYPTIDEFKACFKKARFGSVDVRSYQLKRNFWPEQLMEVAEKRLWSMFKSISEKGLKAGLEKLQSYMNKHPGTPIGTEELDTLVIAQK